MATLALVAVGCGGGDGGTPGTSGQAVDGPGFTFRAPEDWTVKKTPTSAEASQDTETLVSVTVLPLLRPYRPALFPRLVKELDRVAAGLAKGLDGEVTASRTMTMPAGGKVRQYEITHGDLVDRITFVLRGKREYQLTCRWRKGDGAPDACAQLVASFSYR